MTRMNDDRLDNLTQSWQEHVGSLMEEYGAPTVHSILSRTESEAMELLDALKAERQRVVELEEELATIRKGHTVTVEYDLSPAMKEGEIRDKLIELGWSKPNEP